MALATPPLLDRIHSRPTLFESHSIMTDPPRLIITLPLGPSRLVFDLVPGPAGALTVTLTRWDGRAQVGRAVSFPVSAWHRV